MTEQEKEPRTIEQRLAEAEQRIKNLEIEILFPIATAELPDKRTVKRLTIRGAMEALYKKVFPEQSGLKLPGKDKIVVPGRPA